VSARGGNEVRRLTHEPSLGDPIVVRSWPVSADELVREQDELAAATPPWWRPTGDPAIGACFICFERGRAGFGAAGDPGWAGAALVRGDRLAAAARIAGAAGAAYEPGLLALREGPLLAAVVRRLPEKPDILLVNATGRDHPRRAGLALHLGAVLDVPTIGITHRLLVADGAWPADALAASSPFQVAGERVGYWLRTRRGRRPLAIHAAWRTDAETAASLIGALSGTVRTPEALREARRLARTARAEAQRGSSFS
jgi:deoxyribonuclease V